MRMIKKPNFVLKDYQVLDNLFDMVSKTSE